ncbi:MAG: hypothetical protein IPM82_30000 [Saprospiraceae bacterium]|nr:hypothetical protein [Saprospiraceae bacterium]
MRDKKNSTFFGPDKIINALVDINKISYFKLVNPSENITEKLILAYTYFGNYYIAISHSGTEQKVFHVFDAKALRSIEEKDEANGVKIISSLIKEIVEVESYKHLAIPTINSHANSHSKKPYLNFLEFGII